jgi:hypothetical protein
MAFIPNRSRRSFMRTASSFSGFGRGLGVLEYYLFPA